MRIPRLNLTWAAMGTTYANCAYIWVPHAWLPAVLAVDAVFVPWMIYSFVTESPEEKERRRVEARRRKIAELEKDLGYEPLNLGELDEILNAEPAKTERNEP